MKKTLLLTISACLVYLSGLAQTCGTGGIILNSQAQVNAFATTYPGCSQVVEGLEVTGADITNLTGLEGLTDIGPDGNQLLWKTTWESSNKGFDVERSTDMRIFTKIGFIPGHGDSHTQKTYAFTDPATARIVYYRLKQLDEDGSFHYSKTIAVQDKRYAVKVYPNPSKSHLKIDATDRNKAFSIRDAQGTTVMAASVLPSHDLDTSTLQNGLYLLSVGEETFKVLVQH